MTTKKTKEVFKIKNQKMSINNHDDDHVENELISATLGIEDERLTELTLLAEKHYNKNRGKVGQTLLALSQEITDAKELAVTCFQVGMNEFRLHPDHVGEKLTR